MEVHAILTKKEFRSPKTTKINSFPISFDNIVLEKYYNYVIQKNRQTENID